METNTDKSEVIADIRSFVAELEDLVMPTLPPASSGRESLRHSRIADLFAELKAASALLAETD